MPGGTVTKINGTLNVIGTPITTTIITTTTITIERVAKYRARTQPREWEFTF